MGKKSKKESINIKSYEYEEMKSKLSYFSNECLNDNVYFGLMGDKFGAISPSIGMFEDESSKIEYYLFDYSAENMFARSLDKDWPFIFKNLNNGYAQEVVSGKIIRIGTCEEISRDIDTPGTLESFITKYKSIKNNPLVYYLDDDQDFICVDDAYKRIVSKRYTDIKEFKKYMDTIEQGAKKNNKMVIKESKEYTKEIHLVDDLLIDYEKKYSLKKSNKKKNK